MDGAMAPVLRELRRIADMAEAVRDATDERTVAELRSEVSALREEVAALRAVVAHLRAGGAPVPPSLRPVVARAVLAAQEASV